MGLNRKTALLSLTFLTAAAGLLPERAAAQNRELASVSTQSAQIEAVSTQADHIFWRHPSGAATLELWRCPSESGICLRLHFIDAQNPDIRGIAAMTVNNDMSRVTDDYVLSYCGYEARLFDMNEKGKDSKTGALGKWSGKIMLVYPNETVEQAKQRNAKVLNINIEDRLESRNGQTVRSLFLRVTNPGVPGFIWEKKTSFDLDRATLPGCRTPLPKPPLP